MVEPQNYSVYVTVTYSIMCHVSFSMIREKIESAGQFMHFLRIFLHTNSLVEPHHLTLEITILDLRTRIFAYAHYNYLDVCIQNSSKNFPLFFY